MRLDHLLSKEQLASDGVPSVVVPVRGAGRGLLTCGIRRPHPFRWPPVVGVAGGGSPAPSWVGVLGHAVGVLRNRTRGPPACRGVGGWLLRGCLVVGLFGISIVDASIFVVLLCAGL